MVIRPKHSSSATIALQLSKDRVEAIVPRRARGGPAHRLVRFSHDLELGEELAEFIARQLIAHGVPKRSIVLGLAPDLVLPRVIELRSLPQRDLEAVMARRASGLLELEPKEVAYSALALDGEDVEERRWLVHAIAKAPLAKMQKAFRDLGFTVKHVIPGRTAPFVSERCIQAAAAEGATLVALFERDQCAIGLLSGGRIVHVSSIRGGAQDYAEGSPNLKAFVQELRGIDAFWRRASRGESVNAVVVGGLESSFVHDFEPAIRGGLGEVKIELLGGDDAAISMEGAGNQEDPDPAMSLFDDPHDAARMGLLGTFLSSRTAVLDMSVELRPRVRSLIAVSTASALVLGAMAFSVRSDLQEKADQLTQRAAAVHSAVVDLPGLQNLERDVIALESEVRAACEELRAVSAAGISIHDLTDGILSAFGDGLELLSASAVAPIPAQNQDGVVRLRGTVQDMPGATATALNALEDRLAALPGVVGAHVELPSLSDREANESQKFATLKFSAVLNLAATEAGSDS